MKAKSYVITNKDEIEAAERLGSNRPDAEYLTVSSLLDITKIEVAWITVDQDIGMRFESGYVEYIEFEGEIWESIQNYFEKKAEQLS